MKRLTLISTVVVAVALLGGTIVLVEGRRAAHAHQNADPRASDQHRDITVPAGTMLAVSLEDRVGSATSLVDDSVRARLVRPVIVDGVTAVPQGSELIGAVVVAERSHRVKGRARVVVRFDQL